mmetsp:Transcript_40110/g.131047  ORF Transcript_40110/g.131047 Transcript_40110/m.131047 type:complete len:321 (+) Transcript_40110:1258-2220(+)
MREYHRAEAPAAAGAQLRDPAAELDQRLARHGAVAVWSALAGAVPLRAAADGAGVGRRVAPSRQREGPALHLRDGPGVGGREGTLGPDAALAGPPQLAVERHQVHGGRRGAAHREPSLAERRGVRGANRGLRHRHRHRRGHAGGRLRVWPLHRPQELDEPPLVPRHLRPLLHVRARAQLPSDADRLVAWHPGRGPRLVHFAPARGPARRHARPLLGARRRYVRLARAHAADCDERRGGAGAAAVGAEPAVAAAQVERAAGRGQRLQCRGLQAAARAHGPARLGRDGRARCRGCCRQLARRRRTRVRRDTDGLRHARHERL